VRLLLAIIYDSNYKIIISNNVLCVKNVFWSALVNMLDPQLLDLGCALMTCDAFTLNSPQHTTLLLSVRRHRVASLRTRLEWLLMLGRC
jgi:hypothetical protein